MMGNQPFPNVRFKKRPFPYSPSPASGGADPLAALSMGEVPVRGG